MAQAFDILEIEIIDKIIIKETMPFIRSISGVRATIDDSLPPDLIAQYVAAFTKILPVGPIVVGRDGRPSGRWIQEIVIDAIIASGRQAIGQGIVPTPTVQLAVEHSDAAGGIVITASHNPAEWNGLKFIGPDGVFLDAEQNQQLWRLAGGGTISHDTNRDLAPLAVQSNAIDEHINKIFDISMLNESLLNKIRRRNYKVVVDAVNASGSVAIPRLLRKFGCEVIELYCDSTGIFPHTPEPLPVNLTELAAKVKQAGADFGAAVDPDADRLVLIDENGIAIGEEKTIALAVQCVFELSKNTGRELIATVNYSTSRMVDDLARQYGGRVCRSPVGEINVVKEMKRAGAIIGGEGSGGVILPECHYGRDSLVGIALILALMATSGKALSEVSGELMNYSMLKFRKDFDGNIDTIIKDMASLFPKADITLDDGIKVNFPDSWVQLRASNTEPIVRVIAEAPTQPEAEGLANRVLGLL